ncbi:MAG TPA: pilus assembly protein TadG-related protein [bacterium]|nr:pilus assembly protein TadG-related protein [bacterium]HQG46686.1 pilus assembly protein TadG-related protein [bacterium]HQI49617.1 pilus assembly protein TadG-related protein [bacterium]HQJ63952.1 pilus assembly protein TadG-related protein [bacterium]
MRSLRRDERGEVLVFTATIFLTLLLFAAMVTDLGYVLTARNQLQSAVDCAALAGAAGLMNGSDRATAMAIRYASKNDCIQQPVIISNENVTFPASNRVQVSASRTLQLFFLPLIGLNQRVIRASATAELGYVTSTNGLAPWAVPKEAWQPGDRVVIKAGQLGEIGTNPGFYYPVDFPAVNRGNPISGASEYEENIRAGCDETVEIGDILQVEPGEMQGPTRQGVDYLIDADHCAYWDGERVANSLFTGYSSPRVVKVPLYDPSKPPDSGRNTIEVIGFAAFFVEGMVGKTVIGVFIEVTSPGASGHGYSLLRCVHLV